MTRWIALLRGINLGGRMIAMAELRELLAGSGFERVRTHLRSGNVLLDSELSEAGLISAMEGAIAERFGFEVAVIARTRDELAAVVELDPLGEVAGNPKLYQVGFLSRPPAPEAISALEDEDLAPERVIAAGRELYTWHPGGIHSSRLARLLTRRRLGAEVTSRNWNTVTKLLELADREPL